jgi:hypothetical protein
MQVTQNNSLNQMNKAFTDAQKTQAEITSKTSEHKIIMSVLEAIKNAFQAIKA